MKGKQGNEKEEVEEEDEEVENRKQKFFIYRQELRERERGGRRGKTGTTTRSRLSSKIFISPCLISLFNFISCQFLAFTFRHPSQIINARGIYFLNYLRFFWKRQHFKQKKKKYISPAAVKPSDLNPPPPPGKRKKKIRTGQQNNFFFQPETEI